MWVGIFKEFLIALLQLRNLLFIFKIIYLHLVLNNKFTNILQLYYVILFLNIHRIMLKSGNWLGYYQIPPFPARPK